MSTFEDLTKILPPPENPLETPSENGWLNVEAQLEVSLPDDYKEFVARYGTGAVDQFLWVLNPFSNIKYLNLLDEGKAKLEALRNLRHETIPYAIHSEGNVLLPWGVTDNGDVIYWVCNGPSSKWMIVINESRGSRWQEFKLSTTEFLVKLLSGEVAVDVFPDDFPSESPQYTVNV